MSALDTSANSVEGAIVQAAKPAVARLLWAYVDAHLNDRVFSRLGFIHITVGQCRPLVELLVGPDPSTVDLTLPPPEHGA